MSGASRRDGTKELGQRAARFGLGWLLGKLVWAPGILRFVFSALRHVPGPIWRRLPLG